MWLVRFTLKGPSHAHCPVPKSIPSNTPSRPPGGGVSGAGVSKFTVVVTAPLTVVCWRTKTPWPVPAYSVLGDRGSIARALTERLVRPALSSLQLAPPLVLLKTPPATPR